MNIETLAQARKLYPDAEQFVATPVASIPTPQDLRRIVSPSYCIMYCEIHKDNIRVICSQQAKKDSYPDYTCQTKDVYMGKKYHGRIGLAGMCVQVTVDFNLHKMHRFTKAVEMAFQENLVRISFFDEVNMGCFFFQNMSLNDVLIKIENCADAIDR